LKSGKIISLVGSIFLILVLLATGCSSTPTTSAPTTSTAQPTVTAPAPSTATTTVTVEVDKKYNAVNPTGFFNPVQIKSLSPRLSTIEGKTIYVCQGEADPVIMPALWKAIVPKYPKTKFVYYDVSAFGPTVPGTGSTPAASNGLPEDPDIESKVDAVVRGIGW
jgi:hypothetical protein